MINLPIPTSLNGAQLEAELKAAKLPSDFYAHGDEYLVFDATQAQASKIEAVLNAHVAVFKELTVSDKLAAAGIGLEELKAALA